MLDRTEITVKVVLEFDADKVGGLGDPTYEAQQLFLEQLPDTLTDGTGRSCVTLVGAEIVGGLVNEEGVRQN